MTLPISIKLVHNLNKSLVLTNYLSNNHKVKMVIFCKKSIIYYTKININQLMRIMTIRIINKETPKSKCYLISKSTNYKKSSIISIKLIKNSITNYNNITTIITITVTSMTNKINQEITNRMQ